MKPTTAISRVLASLLVVGAGACRCGPAVGGSCDAPRAVCAASSSALECVDGRMQPRPCRGPRGCRELDDGTVDCDDGLAIPGDPCRALGVERAACSPDGSSELLCVGARWQLVATCGGPKGCAVAEQHVDCDDSIAREGDPCASDAGDFACSSDGSERLRCDERRWRADLTCRGERGCAAVGGFVHCDGAASSEGAPCGTEGDVVCSDDSAGILACRGGRFVAAQRCEPRRCAAGALVVRCE